MRLFRNIGIAAVLAGTLLLSASCHTRHRTAEESLRELSAAGEIVVLVVDDQQCFFHSSHSLRFIHQFPGHVFRRQFQKCRAGQGIGQFSL